jgi:hypothetical protein
MAEAAELDLLGAIGAASSAGDTARAAQSGDSRNAQPGFDDALSRALQSNPRERADVPVLSKPPPGDSVEDDDVVADSADDAVTAAASLGLGTTGAAAGAGVEDVPVAERSLDALAPVFRDRLAHVIHRLHDEFGLDVKVVETWRSQERQDALYAQGRTADGPTVTWTRRSNHTRGLAADLVVGGGFDDPAAYATLAKVAAEEGLRTLPNDPGHVELDVVNPTDAGRDRGPVLPGSVIASVADVASPAAAAVPARPALPDGVAPAARIARESGIAATAVPSKPAESAGVAGIAQPARPADPARPPAVLTPAIPAAAVQSPAPRDIATPAVPARTAPLSDIASIASLGTDLDRHDLRPGPAGEAVFRADRTAAAPDRALAAAALAFDLRMTSDDNEATPIVAWPEATRPSGSRDASAAAVSPGDVVDALMARPTDTITNSLRDPSAHRPASVSPDATADSGATLQGTGREDTGLARAPSQMSGLPTAAGDRAALTVPESVRADNGTTNDSPVAATDSRTITSNTHLASTGSPNAAAGAAVAANEGQLARTETRAATRATYDTPAETRIAKVDAQAGAVRPVSISRDEQTASDGASSNGRDDSRRSTREMRGSAARPGDPSARPADPAAYARTTTEPAATASAGAVASVRPAGVDMAARVARVLALRDAAESTPATGVTLLVDGIDGAAARIRLGVRGGAVSTTIDVADPVAAADLGSRAGELQRALATRGLEATPVVVRSATALREMAETGRLAGSAAADVVSVGQRSLDSSTTNSQQHRSPGPGRRDSESPEHRQRRQNKEGRT